MSPYLPLILALAIPLPSLALRAGGVHLDPPLEALVSGVAILAAAFLLLWACDAAQADISQALALAVISLIAVLPEYAVDMYFTWQAGQDPGGGYAQFAIANMTGANRLIIGVGWATVALIAWLRHRRGIVLGRERRPEIAFLGVATLYALVIPLKGSLAWYDGLAFLAIYASYLAIAARRPPAEAHLDGPAALLAALPRNRRRLAVLALLLFSAGAILANAEAFSESLVATGKVLGVEEFLLVQWLAPIASEAPEFIIAVMLALRGQAGVALGSLLAAKLNQWTLLVGMIPGVYGLSLGSLAQPIPMGGMQMNEILLTAAQSLLAVALLVRLRLSSLGAALLLGLFAAQFALPALLAPLSWRPDHAALTQALSALYAVLAGLVLLPGLKGAAALWRAKAPGE
jgi:cation:H+ antiporter